jgi:DNA-binding NarL/FixJ family response regulator
MISVLIVDDQAVVREGLRVILEATRDITVVGEAPDAATAVDLAPRLHPDVVLMDVRMPRMDGIEAARRLLGPQGPRVIMLSTFGEEEYLYGALQAGASGFHLKDCERSEIVNGVRAVAAGDRLLAPEFTRRPIEAYIRRRPTTDATPLELADLTERELEVARLVACGLSNAEIAQRLVVHDQDPRCPHPAESPRQGSNPARRPCIRVRPRRARKQQTLIKQEPPGTRGPRAWQAGGACGDSRGAGGGYETNQEEHPDDRDSWEC